MPKLHKYQARGKPAYLFRIKNPISGKRTKLRLGPVRKSFAEEASGHIDTVLEAIEYGQDLPPKTVNWLSGLPDTLYERIANTGLIETRDVASAPTLQEFLFAYAEMKSGRDGRSGGWKPTTESSRRQSINELVAYFGGETPVDAIGAGDAEEMLAYLQRPAPQGRGLQSATAGKRVKDARQFLEHARRKGHIRTNPFEGVRLPSQENPDRLHYVPLETVEAVLQHVDCPQWRLLIALARYAGFRTPSEAQQLRWRDVNFSENTILAHASKKAHDRSGGKRICRLLPELIPYFEAVRDSGQSPADFVVPDMVNLGRSSLRQRFLSYIGRAGLEPWPRVFQNLRASAATDLADRFPIHKVCKWIGHSVDTAKRHYLILRNCEYEGPRLNGPGDGNRPSRNLDPKVDQIWSISGRLARFRAMRTSTRPRKTRNFRHLPGSAVALRGPSTSDF